MLASLLLHLLLSRFCFTLALTAPRVDLADDIKPALTRISFGSCHSRGALDQRLSSQKDDGNITHPSHSTIWDVISTVVHPQTFLWTGDAVYPPKKIRGDTPLSVMHEEYRQMLQNETLGYANFLRQTHLEGGVHGTWDDHDYGGNDRGRELEEREARRDAYLDFLGVSKGSPRRNRTGLYGSVEFGAENVRFGTDSFASASSDKEHEINKTNNKVKVIFLDTRWHRATHCIPSAGSSRYIPLGAIVACTTRLITAGFNLPNLLPSWFGCPNDAEMLGEDQWKWLENELNESTASMHIVISSVQVLTTNPVVESWGHFPEERKRLLRLLNNVEGLVILSGDVHHAEISVSSHATNNVLHSKNINQPVNNGAIVEVTSSGLTHSCEEPFYGRLCAPILDAYSRHRFVGGNVKNVSSPSYYTGRNFGSIDIDWLSRRFKVNVHDASGDIVLTTGSLSMDAKANVSDREIGFVAQCIDGHFFPFLWSILPLMAAVVVFFVLCLLFLKRFSWSARIKTKEE